MTSHNEHFEWDWLERHLCSSIQREGLFISPSMLYKIVPGQWWPLINLFRRLNSWLSELEFSALLRATFYAFADDVFTWKTFYFFVNICSIYFVTSLLTFPLPVFRSISFLLVIKSFKPRPIAGVDGMSWWLHNIWLSFFNLDCVSRLVEIRRRCYMVKVWGSNFVQFWYWANYINVLNPPHHRQWPG